VVVKVGFPSVLSVEVLVRLVRMGHRGVIVLMIVVRRLVLEVVRSVQVVVGDLLAMTICFPTLSPQKGGLAGDSTVLWSRRG
jgi:hypothetical protein